MTILHVNNLCVIMGTICHTLTMVKAFPEHRHIVLFVWTQNENEYLLDEFKKAGATVLVGAGGVNRAVVEKWNPDIVILNNERPEFIDPAIAPELASERVLVSYSHDRDIVTPSTFNIWNSNFTMNLHKGGERSHVTRTIVMGSYIDTAPFAAIKRDYERPPTVGMLTTGPRRFKAKLSEHLIALFMRVKVRYPDMRFVVPNIDKLFPVPRWVASPDYTHSPVTKFFRDIDIFVHYTNKSSSDGWGRPVTEAMAAGLPVVAEKRGGVVEQIDPGVDGYLARDETEFVEDICALCDDSRLRELIGTAAREKACAQFGIPAIRSTLTGVLTLADERRRRRT